MRRTIGEPRRAEGSGGRTTRTTTSGMTASSAAKTADTAAKRAREIDSEALAVDAGGRRASEAGPRGRQRTRQPGATARPRAGLAARQYGSGHERRPDGARRGGGDDRGFRRTPAFRQRQARRRARTRGCVAPPRRAPASPDRRYRETAAGASQGLRGAGRIRPSPSGERSSTGGRPHGDAPDRTALDRRVRSLAPRPRG